MGQLTVPDEVARLVAGFPDVDADELAFPFVTVDPAGFPHAALLSRSELAVSPDSELVAAVRSPNTKSNLDRSGQAALIAVAGTAAHYLKLRVVHNVVSGDLTGYLLRVAEHKRDSIGIPLTPVGFRTTAELSRAEHWAHARSLIEHLLTRK